MNETVRMMNQGHNLLFRETAGLTAGDERHTAGMRRGAAGGFQDGVEAEVMIAGEDGNRALSARIRLEDRPKKIVQLGSELDGEESMRIVITALRVFEDCHLFFEIKIPSRDARLIEPAAGADQDLEDDGHPGAVLSLGECRTGSRNVRIGQIRLLGGSFLWDADAGKGIAIADFPLDGLINEERKELQFEPGSIVLCLPAQGIRSLSPGKKFLCVLTFNLAGVTEAIGAQVVRDIQPGCDDTIVSTGIRIMELEKSGNPINEVPATNGPESLLFRRLSVRHSPSTSRFGWNRNPHLRALFHPFARLEVAVAKKEVGASRVRSQRGHVQPLSTLSHTLTQQKYNDMERSGVNRVKVVKGGAQTSYRYTIGYLKRLVIKGLQWGAWSLSQIDRLGDSNSAKRGAQCAFRGALGFEGGAL